MSAPTATVLRKGEKQEIETKALVPGDVILIEAGDIILADGRLIEARFFKTQEASLAGESDQEMKQAKVLAAQDVPLSDPTEIALQSFAQNGGFDKKVWSI